MIKRTSKNHIQKILSENKSWKVLDIGCGYTPNEYATTICDVQDLSNFYKDKYFIKLSGNVLPFKSNEFDFVIASHVIEHVKDVKTFINELSRISSKGYIELPTILEDNLVFENKKDHIWQMEFDDIDNKLNISERIQYLEPVVTVSTSKMFSNIFRQSLVLELYWEDKIEFNLINKNKNEYQKISRLVLFRKFLSKYLRNILRQN